MITDVFATEENYEKRFKGTMARAVVARTLACCEYNWRLVYSAMCDRLR